MAHQFFSEQSASGSKRERTRAALLDSAISILASKGFEATRIIDITEHAGVANGTFYNYFSDKEALLGAAAQGIAVEIARQIDEQMGPIDNAIDRVVNGTARMMEAARREPEWFTVLLEGVTIIPALHTAATRYLRQDIERGIEQGHFDVEVDLLLVNQVLALVRTSFLLDPRLPPSLVKRTCESQLRLLGVPRKRAAARVGRILGQQTRAV